MGCLVDWQIERDIGINPFERYDREKQMGRISWGGSSMGYDARLGYRFKVFKPYPVRPIDPKDFDPAMLIDVELFPCHRWAHGALKRDDGNFYTTVLCRNCNKERCETGSDAREVCPKHEQPDHLLIPPYSFVLGETFEEFTIPRDVLCVVVGKSTYARCGLIVNVTPGEPEWTGKWTVELTNPTPLPMKVYPGEGIMQCLFFRSDGHRQVIAEILQTHVLPRDFPYTITAAMTGNSPAPMTCRESYADKKGKYNHQPGLVTPKVT